MRTTALLLTMLLLVLTSCAKRTETENALTGEPLPMQLPPAEGRGRSPMSDLKPAPRQADSVLINAGALPLVHLFDQGGQVRIVNATTKQTLLTTSVAARSIISVSDSGILVARQRRLTTALNAGHRYEIWWDVGRGQ